MGRTPFSPETAARRLVAEPRCTRRVALLTGIGSFLVPAVAAAEAVPYPLQAQLMAKVASYDRRFRQRNGARVVALLVTRRGNAESAQVAQQLKAALAELPTIGDLPHQEEVVSYDGVDALARLVRERKAGIVYFCPGFDGEIPALRKALASARALTVASIPDYVASGVVLGFDLVSGKPKLLVHLAAAIEQGIELLGRASAHEGRWLSVSTIQRCAPEHRAVGWPPRHDERPFRPVAPSHHQVAIRAHAAHGWTPGD